MKIRCWQAAVNQSSMPWTPMLSLDGVMYRSLFTLLQTLNHTSLCRLFSCISTSVPLVSFSDFRIVAAGYFCFKKFRIGVATFSAGVFCFCRLLLHAASNVRLHKHNSKTDNLVFMTCCFFIVTIRGEFPIELCLERNNSFVFMVVRHDNNMPFLFFSFFSCYVFVSLSS